MVIAGVRTRWWSSSPLTTAAGLPICFDLTAGHIHHVTQKEIVLDAISELPDEVSLREIAERIEFLAAIQKGMDQLDRGEGIPHEEVKRQLAAWLAS
jgi:predicted transcriptional regulator